MNKEENLIELVISQNSADNNLRVHAELEFNRTAGENPTRTVYELIRACAHDSSHPIDVKQSCLLHLKRLVPKFWSAGFQLFIGPPIEQETKAFIRESLLLLATSSTSSKIRSGSSYVIVQIAAVDFPDEWPDLLEKIYTRATENQSVVSVVGSLSVLNDLFDDLISESQFWEGGVGNKLISFVGYLLQQPGMSPEIKISALRLHLTVLDTLLSPEAHELEERKRSVASHVKFLSEVLLSLVKDLINLSSSSISVELVQLSLRSYLYQVFTKILNSFRKQFLSCEISDLIHVLNEDISLGSKVTLDSAQFEKFTVALSMCAQYPKVTMHDYTEDFNLFVTSETGLSSQTTIRDSIKELLSELNERDAVAIFQLTKLYLSQGLESWIELEAMLFLSEGLFLDQDSITSDNGVSLTPYLESLYSLILSSNSIEIPPLLMARVILLVPRVFGNFSKHNSADSLCASWLEKIFDICTKGLVKKGDELILASALISVTLWKSLDNFDLKKMGLKLQSSIMETCYLLLDDSDEDTLPIILEAISAAISIDNVTIFKCEIEENLSVVDLFLRVSFKDPANIQVTIDSSECLQVLLSNIGLETFLGVCQKLVPFLVEVIRTTLSQNCVQYTPQLDLALELLGYVIEASPCPKLPKDIFHYIFPVLRDLILKASDDQILQSAGELFNKLMQNNESLFIKYSDPDTGQSGLDILLHIASKFLSLNLSDQAAMNCGLIVITIFERFQTCLNSDFFFQLLEATVRRVAIAKEVLTVENLILVFCNLALNTATHLMIDALISMQISDSSGNLQDGLRTVLPIWFESFEVTRGVEKIQKNILALGRIFSLGDPRVESIKVNGDLIPYDGDLIITRSMAKSMPQKFTRISASQKILKLLVSELRFQSLQPDSDDYVLHNSDDGDDEDGWEDMDGMGIPNYDKLKSYVDSDEEEHDQMSDKGIKDTLVQFFKECITKNVANFQFYYEMLDDDEKAAISENVIFA
ncbi:ARM repeat-containing protein [Metschnikowia bicuspidata var. bicuspidata NRRL YB-4993]|uniref:ARM repeat-containing protein n=1 Tax=Metschnikowia bicuspidata var. bicuspidata NRRL YB-4993 TaxID=869754 RepID=A0A1A0HBC6_9ASCO|nr:ARM repeat-containing protein [Metschnikowia bicuspidata var. bicuspidata NRRL YB-4993]OBA21177.1 ARM repeat-containing protein [Metschnikowia bicuspidata var. bicuspidata NRRL YB-4993]